MPIASIIRSFRPAALLGAAAIAWAGIASAQLTAPGALPGGVTLTDNDSGNGQRWGRAGGRTITFSVNTPEAFSELTWGVANGTSPTLAFDGAVTPGSPEIMVLNLPSSTFTSRAVWTGAAVISTSLGTALVPTRFTLTITPAVALLPQPGGASPGIDVLAAPTFSANLLFEMQYINLPGADGQWHPVLDKYDALNTPPGQPPSTNTGPVMTGVTTGFYYTGATPVGLDLDQHDAHIAGLVGSVKGDTDFMRIELTNRLPMIQADLGEIQADLGEVRGKVTHDIPAGISQILSQLQQPGGPTDAATPEDVSNAKDDLQNTLLILFGLMPCPAEAGPLCSTAKFIKDLSTQASVDLVKTGVDGILIGLSRVEGDLATVQSSLDQVAGMALQVQAVPVDTAGRKQARFIVKTTLDGAPVGATLAGIRSVRTGGAVASLQDVTGQSSVVAIAPGLYDVTIDLGANGKDATGAAYLFEASFGAGGTIAGSTLVEAGN